MLRDQGHGKVRSCLQWHQGGLSLGKEGHKVLPATKRELQGIAPWKMAKQILKSNSKELS